MRRLNASRLRSAPPVALALAAAMGLVAGGVPTPRLAWAQSASQPAEARLSQAQLEQMLAPIALYPDDLLAQMLMAATYPMEIVQAARWLARDDNAKLQGDALASALAAQPWDPSVKSLVPFPDVLKQMNEQLEWTQALGDAVLAQQEDVFNAVQVLRGRAQAAGKLESGPQQVVNVSQNVTVAAPAPGAPPPVVAPPPQIITIAPAQPDRVYVPVYDPGVVFGPWPWPSYPPVFYPPPPAWGLGNALLTGMAFAGGAAIVGSLWGWARPGWGRGNIDIDVNRVNNINVNRNQITSNRWQHDVTHRHGVAYANQDVRNRFQAGGAGVDRAQAARDEFRGRTAGDRPGGGFGDRPAGGPGDRPGGGFGDRLPGGQAGDRPGGGLADRMPGDRPGIGSGNLRPGDGPGGNLADRRPGDGPGGNLADRRPGDGPGGNLADRRPGGAPGGNLADRRPGDGPGGSLADRRPGDGNRPTTLPAGGGNRPTTRPAGDPNRPAVGQTPGGRPAIGQTPSGRPAPTTRPAPQPNRAPQALQGIGQGSDIRAAQQRGQASRQAPVSRPAPTPAQRPAMQGGGGGQRPALQGGGGGQRAAMQGGGGQRPAAQGARGGRAGGGGHGGGGRLGR